MDWTDVVCRTAVERLDVDAAAICLRAGADTQELLGATDVWAQGLAELQYTTGEGPGVDASGSGSAVLVTNLMADRQRWPGFSEGALARGAGAVYAFPLGGAPPVLGTIDLYRHAPGGLSGDERELAALLADLATTALLTGTWTPDERHYADVDVAAGMVAAQLEVPVAEAFLRLRAHAFRKNKSLVDLAEDVITRRLRVEGQA